MSIRDISNAQAAYQQDWRKLYQQPLEFIGDINKTADGYRALQQNLDTQDWRTQAINSENEMSTINDALKNEQIEGLRQYMTFNKNNAFDANGNKIGYNTQLKGLAQDPNSNPFAFNYMKEQQPAQQVVRGGGRSGGGSRGSRGGYGDSKWYDGFVNRAYRNAQEVNIDPNTGEEIYTGGMDINKLNQMIAMEARLRPERAEQLLALKQRLDPTYNFQENQAYQTPSVAYGAMNNGNHPIEQYYSNSFLNNAQQNQQAPNGAGIVQGAQQPTNQQTLQDWKYLYGLNY